jgi:hypothetical protein
MTPPRPTRLASLARLETKYLLPTWRVPALRADLRALLPVDPHGATSAKPGYSVRSLYLETVDLLTHRDKLAGLYDRFKLRVRAYSEDELVLEIKRKAGAYVFKDRTRITPDDLTLIYERRFSGLLDRYPDDDVVRRFTAAAVSLGAVCPLVISYRREAFARTDVYERATIDTEFRACAAPDLSGKRFRGRRFGHGVAILEVKGKERPAWLPRLVRRHHLDPRSVSKFSLACGKTHVSP